MYELVLWHQGNEAVRITDKAVSVGQTLLIDDIKWLVEAQELPRDLKATARYICSRRAATSSNRKHLRAARTSVPNVESEFDTLRPSEARAAGSRSESFDDPRPIGCVKADSASRTS
jgi:hypothetical protein